MTIQKIISDFDGVYTNPVEESLPAISKWDELFSERTDIPLSELMTHLETIARDILADPTTGWINNGCVMAPATADPYILHTSVYQTFMQQFQDRYPALHNPESNKTLLTEVFHASYAQAVTVFRPGAKEFLDELVHTYDTTIVTNSKTDVVIRKLHQLGIDDAVVKGDAGKHTLDTAYTAVPLSIKLSGFPRSVFLQRKKYSEVLANYQPATTAVIGDVYELDLALPEWLGFRIIQFVTANTPAYELAYHDTKQNNFYAKDYAAVMDAIKK